MDFEILLICFALLLVAALYSSVGHGGASGYLAVLSLTSFAMMGSAWLKQHAWCLNIVVATIAFWHYQRAGYHVPKLTLPFVVASVPFAMLGGYMRVGGVIYDSLLSIALLWAAWRLYNMSIENKEIIDVKYSHAIPIGGSIGLVSGIVGVGGGIFLSPILLLKRWATPKTAAATSALFIWLNSVAGLCGATFSGQLDLDWSILISFIGAVLIGGFVGSRFGAIIAPQSAVRKMLVVVLLVAVAKQVFELVV